MKYLSDLFEQNRAWAAAQTERDPDFFNRLVDVQQPDYLWIGCADSRVPANEIVGLAPGELFVHRNIANLVRYDDPNCMAVVQFAVENLSISHIIVCGHYRCGGVRASMEGGTAGFVDAWLAPLRRIAERRTELTQLADPEERWRRMCEINVIEQTANLAQTDVLQRAWSAGRKVSLHGWIYALEDGLLRDLGVTAAGPAEAAAARAGFGIG